MITSSPPLWRWARAAGATGASWHLTHHFSNYWGTAPALQTGSLEATIHKTNGIWHESTARALREQTAPYAFESLSRDTLNSYTDWSVQCRFKSSYSVERPIKTLLSAGGLSALPLTLSNRPSPIYASVGLSLSFECFKWCMRTFRILNKLRQH